MTKISKQAEGLGARQPEVVRMGCIGQGGSNRSQRTKHEESQKRISQELVDLQAELKKMDNAEEEVMETEEDQEIDELLEDATKEVAEASNTAKLVEMQAAMEAQYQQRIMEERQRMQQYFSEQFINLARVNIDPYMQQEGMILTPEAEEGKDATADGPPGLTVRNVRAPFGVQRVSKANQVTSPYRRQEEKDKPDDGTTDGRGTSDGPAAASRYRTRGFQVTDTCGTRTSANGAVMYNWERCETRGKVGKMDFVKTIIAQHERLVVFVLMILGDIMAFAATFLWLSWKDGVQGKDSNQDL